MAGFHVHFPNTCPAWRILVLVFVLNADIIGSTVFHPLEIMGQRSSAVRRQIVDWPKQAAPFAGPKVIHAANIAAAIVRAVIPDDFIRSWPPLKSGALLPVPSRRFSDFGPFVTVFEIDKADISAVARLNNLVLEIDLHTQEVASRSIELKALVKEKPCISSVSAGSRVRNANDSWVTRVAC